MVFDKIQPGGRAVLMAAAGVLVASGLIGSLPARAQEDTNPFNSVLGFVGLQFDKEKESIDYRARPPIVLPPKLDLPPPKEAVRDPSWPADPDIAERRRAALESQRPAPQLMENARAELTQAELQRGRGDLPTEGPASECQASSGTPICLYAPWKALQAVVGGGQPETLTPGVEPPRKYLTEPPPGYRKATAAVKATAAEAPKDQPDVGDAAAYIRSQRHKTSVPN
ncbi:hypothetical protein [Methylocapsa aurea]|uniref:hypothetical protein n=1 Tax=Methylocapsa aurea TaxID=663610 RepID=UPI0012EC598A|nr:hypothetical protein [Methylocapsa aurea]